ncbi:MAG: alpha/beta hydrolase [Pseudomonadales bacterium]|nr:alpha/beta hydrolase [Pseudomonadales bacterium]
MAMDEIVPAGVRDPRIATTFVEANGLRFEVDTCGTGDRLALCLHGFPEHSFSWRYQLPMLAELGYRAWAPNLRGYGNSSRPLGMEAYSIECLMADVAGLIDASGCREVVLLAHDWGAVIAWYFAMRKLRPIERLVICNVPHPGPAQEALSNGLAQLRKSWYIFFFQIPGLPERLLGRDGARAVGEAFRRSAVDRDRFPDEVLEVYRRNAAQPGALTAMVNYYRALVRGGGAKRQRAAGFPVIETPTLMVWGEDDVALTKETTYGTDRYVRDLTIRYLPHVSHWVQQEAPEAVNAMIRAFLLGRPVPCVKWRMELEEVEA